MKRMLFSAVFFVFLAVFTTACNNQDNEQIYSDDSEISDGDTEVSFKVNSFDASPSWGNAPLSTTLKWEIENAKGQSLKCTLDVDGDGEVDHNFDPCPLKGEQLYEFVEPGRYAPVLKVQSSTGLSIEKTAELFSNKIAFFKTTKFASEAEGFISSAVSENELILNFKDSTSLPEYIKGDVILGTDGKGYLVKVVSVTKEDSKLIIQTEPAALEDAIEEAKFGVKEEPLEILSAECVENCEMVGDVAVGPSILKGIGGSIGKSVKFDVDLDKYMPEYGSATAKMEFGIKVTYYIDIDLLLRLKEFSLETSFVGDLGAEITLTKEFEKSFPAPRMVLFSAPMGPLVLTFGLTPQIDLSAEIAASFSVGIGIETGYKTRIYKDETTSELKGGLTPLFKVKNEKSLSISGEAKLAVSPAFDILIYNLAGPEIKPSPYVKANIEYEVLENELCISAATGADIELSGKLKLFKKERKFSLEKNLFEYEFYKECFGGEDDSDDIDDSVDDSADDSADEIIINDEDENDNIPDEDVVIKNPDDLLGEWDFTDSSSHISIMKNDQTGGYMLDINLNNYSEFYMCESESFIEHTFTGQFTIYVEDSPVTGYMTAVFSLTDGDKLNADISGDLPMGSKTLAGGIRSGAYCGDSIINNSEICDGGTKACSEISAEYTTGNAACESDCSGWDTKVCAFPNFHGGLNWSNSSSATMIYDEANTYCQNMNGRLPTISELRVLIQSCPATEAGGTCNVTDACLMKSCWNDCLGCTADGSGKYSVFADTGWFWSSSQVADVSGSMWVLQYMSALIDRIDKSNKNFVRCVTTM